MPNKTFSFDTLTRPLKALEIPQGMTAQEALGKVLRLPSVCSKRFLTTKVDRHVTGEFVFRGFGLAFCFSFFGRKGARDALSPPLKKIQPMMKYTFHAKSQSRLFTERPLPTPRIHTKICTEALFLLPYVFCVFVLRRADKPAFFPHHLKPRSSSSSFSPLSTKPNQNQK